MITLQHLPSQKESLTYRCIKPSSTHHLKVSVKIMHFGTYEFQELFFFRGSYTASSVRQAIDELQYYDSESERTRVRYVVMSFDYILFDSTQPLPTLKEGEIYKVDAFHRDDFSPIPLYMFAHVNAVNVQGIKKYFEKHWGSDTEIIQISVINSPYETDGNF